MIFCWMENGLIRMQFYNSRAWLKSNMASSGKTQLLLLLRLFSLSLLIKGCLDWLSWSVSLSQELSHYWEMLTCDENLFYSCTLQVSVLYFGGGELLDSTAPPLRGCAFRNISWDPHVNWVKEKGILKGKSVAET